MPDSYDRDEAPTQTATEPTDVSPAIPIDAATVVGRFAVLGSIGAGGMGQVFSAYDPQLDRRVALKLLHGVGDDLERQRLIREAQALARLAHPNVVAVHEVGAHEGRVFVAMEFVDGATLRDWMDANPPGTTERLVRALELLLEAGRGIQAAHAAGLVHRDIKPRNILVGTDGRVRVVDFGLARTHGGEAEEMLATGRGDAGEREDPLGSASGSGPLLSAALTQTGSVLGTPAYMAPEQFRRGPVDHAADQFAFCVTAWEVLFGARPFGGTVAAMLLAIHDGAIERPAGVEVPAEIERALRRGLAQNASRRHRDMTALLGVLEDALATAKGATRVRGGSRRGWMLAGGIAVVASGAAFWLGARDVARCEGAQEKFAGVWDPARKAEIRSAVMGTGASFAEGAWTRLEANVDAWRVVWIDGHRDACEATQVRGEQSARLMDLRMSCLDSRRQRLAAYLDLLGNATTEVVANADEGFASLPSVERCADVAYVEHRGQRSEDPEVAAIEDEVLAEVARANTLQAAGDYEGALVIAEAAVAKADAAGSDLARAHARLAQGVAMAALHRPDAALDSLADAYRAARANGIGEVAVDASRRAAVVAGLALDRLDDGRWWISIAAIEAEQSGSNDAIVNAEIADAKLLARAGRYDEARPRLESALAAAPATGLLHADALRTLGFVEVLLGELDAGLGKLVESRRMEESRVGSEHPALADSHNVEAMAFLARSDLDAAHASATRALEITQGAFGADHIAVYPFLAALANVTWAQGDAEATLDLMRRAKQVNRPTSPGPVAAARILAREGETLAGMGRIPEAITSLRAALDGSVAALGRWHHATAVRRVELAAVLADAGQVPEALELVQDALASEISAMGPQNPELVRLHDLVAHVLERGGELERAAEHMRRALAASPSGALVSVTSVKLHTNLCGIVRQLGRGREAIEPCTSALEQAAALPGLPDAVRAHVHNNACAAFSDMSMFEEAKAQCLAGLRIHSRGAKAADDMLAAILRSNIAEIDLRAGRAREAIDGYGQSVATRERLLGTMSPSLLVPLRGLAEGYLLVDDHAAAVKAARRAVEIGDAAHVDALARGHAHMLLARALWRDPKQRREATTLANRASTELAEAGPQAMALVVDLEAWRAAPATAPLIPR